MAMLLSKKIFKTMLPALAACCLLSQGCSEDTTDMEKTILSRDASFQSVIDKRNSMLNEIAAEKAAYLTKIGQMDQQIEALKDQKLQVRTESSSRIERISRKLNPEKSSFKGELLDMRGNLRLKEVQVEAIDKSINEINELIKKEDTLAMTQEEMRTWNDRLASLVNQKEELVSQMEKLSTDIEITEMKVKVLSSK